MIQNIESAEHETNQWKQTRLTETCLQDIRALAAFIQGFQFRGERFPIRVSPQTWEHIEQLLTSELVRLKNAIA
jgi:hypothetical protein